MTLEEMPEGLLSSAREVDGTGSRVTSLSSECTSRDSLAADGRTHASPAGTAEGQKCKLPPSPIARLIGRLTLLFLECRGRDLNPHAREGTSS